MASSATTPDVTKPAKGIQAFPYRHYLVWLYAAIFLFHLPTILIYLRSLWDQPHYQQFVPFAILAAGYFVYQRLSSFKEISLRTSSFWANVFLALSIVPLVVGNLIFDVNIMAAGLFCVLASFLARIYDRKTLMTLLPAAFILLPAVRPPSNIDIKAIAYLQQFTTAVASKILDVLGILHNVQGNTIVMPDGGQFFIEEACSGVQSFFTLIFCALAFAVFEKRTVLHTLLLLVAAAFWSAFANTIRVFSICAADTVDIDLANGTPHMALGYACLAFGIAMLYSTDCFLNYMLGTKVESDQPSLMTRLIRIVSPNYQSSSSKGKKSSLLTKIGIGTACGVILLFSLTPFVRLGIGKLFTSLTEQRYNVTELELALMGDEKQIIGEKPPREWTISPIELKKREHNSDWGTFSNLWIANSGPLKNITLSCDYPFFAFHELSGCYRGNGWKIEKRTINEDFDEIPFVEIEMTRNTVEKGFLVFSLIDRYAQPVPIEADDITQTNFFRRAINSFNRRMLRNYGPGTQSFQFQLFQASNQPLKEGQKDAIRKLFVHGRKKVQTEIESRN